MVRITIVGREVSPITCSEGSNTKAVKDDLIGAFGPGLLKKGEDLVFTETLSGEYEFHMTGKFFPTSLFVSFFLYSYPPLSLLLTLSGEIK